MTDMTPEEINRMIAEWVGCEPKFMSVNGVTYDQHCEPFPKDYYGSNAAMDLLGVLVERGYKPELSYHNLNWWCKFSLPGYKQPEYYAMKPTIPEAICNAICELIEREGRDK